MQDIRDELEPRCHGLVVGWIDVELGGRADDRRQGPRIDTWLSIDLRNRIWDRLATDLRVPRLDGLWRTISLSRPPQALEEIVTTGVIGRTVVELSDPAAAVH